MEAGNRSRAVPAPNWHHESRCCNQKVNGDEFGLLMITNLAVQHLYQ